MLNSKSPVPTHFYLASDAGHWIRRGLIVGTYFGSAYGVVAYLIGGLAGALLGAGAGLLFGATIAIEAALIRHHFRGDAKHCERWERAAAMATIAGAAAYVLLRLGVNAMSIMLYGLPAFWGMVHALLAKPPTAANAYLGNTTGRSRVVLNALPALILAVNASMLAFTMRSDWLG